jgi:acyl carrier protein
MTRSDIHARLTAIFRDVFDDDGIEIADSTSAKDIRGWDSVKMVKLVLAAEERFGVRMRSREIDALKNVGDWIELIGKKLAG